ncbi:MAG: PaaX family transcriptional regulator C-terminal domain-containing protein, partial [Nocardioides sp.]
RLAIRRLVEHGEFVQEGRGRRGLLRRTADAELRERHDVGFVDLAYAQDLGLAPWSGHWHLLAFTIPERRRGLRDRARRTLNRLGAATLPGGFYVSPHPWEETVFAECPELLELDDLLVASSDRLSIGRAHDSRAVAEALWPLDKAAVAHRRLRDFAGSISSSPPGASSTATLAIALRLATAFEDAHRHDPLLPTELLPDGWAGTAARARFAEAWTTLSMPMAEAGVVLFERYAAGSGADAQGS